MLITALVAFVLFVGGSLLAGADFLLWVLPGGLPLGNLLMPSGMLAAAAIPLLVKPGGRRFRAAAWFGVALAAVWLPLGIALAGNPELDFINRPAGSLAFHSYTVATMAVILGMLLVTFFLTVRTAMELSEFDE
ncbi:MAG: hypothetical protein R3200_10325 [Xanthomonadales bacterium]|nr:hypothetical protein [Xanthomonadales bacterium]